MKRLVRYQVWIVAAVVSISLLAIVVWHTDLADVRRMAANVRGAELLGALATFAVINFVCSLRLAASFGAFDAKRLLVAADINMLHTILLGVLPARLGDLYYPILLARMNVRVGRALINLLLLRLFDAAILGITFLTAGLTIVALPELGLMSAIAIIVALLLSALAGLAALPKLCRIAAGLALGSRRPFLQRIARQALDGQRWLNALTLFRRFGLFGLTLLYWAASALLVWFVIAAFGIKLSVARAAFVASGLSLAGALPLQTIAGFGVAEASLTLLLMIVGFPSAEAASIGVVARLGMLALSIIGPILWLAPRWSVTQWRKLV